MDITPTLLDLAGVTHPFPNYQGREILPVRGASLVPYLFGSVEQIHNDDHVTGWELFGRKAIRRGHWKAVFIPAPAGPAAWQLYDLDIDPAEIHDQSEARPDILNDLLAQWQVYVAETGVLEDIPTPPLL